MKRLSKIILIIGVILTAIGINSYVLKWPGMIFLVIGPIGIFLSLILKMNRNDNVNKGLKNRLLQYVVFMISSFLLPFILTPLLIAISGNRETGMGYGFMIPFLVVNIVFSFFIINSGVIVKLLSGLIVTILTLGFLWIVMSSKILESKHDMYGIWSALLTYIFASLTIWEYTFRTIEKIKNSTS